MSAIQYLSAFRLYGWDVLLLAGVVSLLTTLLKKTVFEGAPKKLFVFLPFAIGIVLYAVYRAIVTLSVQPFTSDFTMTLEGGFACGCAATLYYVIYEQFFRKEDGSDDTGLPDTDGTPDTDDAAGDTEDDTADDTADGEENADTGAAISPVAPLLEGYVPEETRYAVANDLFEGAQGRTGDDLRAFVRETLNAAAPVATDAELAALTELIVSYLTSLMRS